MKLPLVAGLLLLVPACLAQETRGIIFGHIDDPSSSAIAGAAVTVRNIDTNVVEDLKTNEAGHYEAPLLIPGNYQVAVQAGGFRRSLREAI